MKDKKWFEPWQSFSESSKQQDLNALFETSKHITKDMFAYSHENIL